MKHWFTTMWPDCKQFLKILGIVYGLLWAMCVFTVVNSGFPFWFAIWGVTFWLLVAASISILGFLASTL